MDRAKKYHGSADLHTPIHPPRKGKMEENEVVEVEPKEKKRKPKFFIYLEIIGPVFIT